jgi:hypothetical protein
MFSVVSVHPDTLSLVYLSFVQLLLFKIYMFLCKYYVSVLIIVVQYSCRTFVELAADFHCFLSMFNIICL